MSSIDAASWQTAYPGFLIPSYDRGGLAGVLPAILCSLGVPLDLPSPRHAVPAARHAVVVLADGLGWEQLRERSGHAPFLRRAMAAQGVIAEPLTAGFPSTTATSMGNFGTGRGPGVHGLVGYQVQIPGTTRIFNELGWQGGPDPVQWQPEPTMFEQATDGGVDVTMVGPSHFDGSGLSTAALRGARFTGAEDLPGRVDATLAALRAAPRDRSALIYLYWGEVDKAGHVHGASSWQWGEELEQLDAELARLHRSLPTQTSLTLTADHGMVDVPADARIDVAHDAELRDGVRAVGGELRAPQVYCLPGAAPHVLATWRERLGDQAWVLSREEAVQTGLFGPVLPRVLPRLGDVIVAMHAPAGIFDGRVMMPRVSGLVGHHGSLTSAEQLVPLIHWSAA